jgi:hypothetical protein
MELGSVPCSARIKIGCGGKKRSRSEKTTEKPRYTQCAIDYVVIQEQFSDVET